MSVVILNQPSQINNKKIVAAYRPIVFDVDFPVNTPVTYCDIYFNGVYYKTISKTTPEINNTYRFDISDASQEYLKSELPPINGQNSYVPTKHFLECYCKFRKSITDSNGFIEQETPVPVQATSTSVAVAGGGIQSEILNILNAVLQHENNQNLQIHLESINNITTNGEILPLTHRPKNYKLCKNDSDYFPIWYNKNVECQSVKITYKDGTVKEFTNCVTYENADLELYGTHNNCVSSGSLKITPNNNRHINGFIVQLQVTLAGKLTLGPNLPGVDNHVYNTGTHIIDIPFDYHDFDGYWHYLYYKLEDINNSDNLPATVNIKILNGFGETFDNQEINDEAKCEKINTAPSVNIRWNETDSTENRTTTAQTYNFDIEIIKSDSENNINSQLLQRRVNGGAWIDVNSSLISNYQNSINVNETWEYRAVITDVGGLSNTSNILKITRNYVAPPVCETVTFQNTNPVTGSYICDGPTWGGGGCPSNIYIWIYNQDPMTVNWIDCNTGESRSHTFPGFYGESGGNGDPANEPITVNRRI